MAEYAAPFQLIEDTLNNVPIEEQPDGSFLIGTPALDTIEEPELREWDSNLVETLDEQELSKLASSLISDYEDDASARDDWLRVYQNGLETLKPDERQIYETSVNREQKRLTNVVHPMIAEAATQFQAQAFNELLPPSGPVRTHVVGEKTKSN